MWQVKQLMQSFGKSDEVVWVGHSCPTPPVCSCGAGAPARDFVSEWDGHLLRARSLCARMCLNAGRMSLPLGESRESKGARRPGMTAPAAWFVSGHSFSRAETNIVGFGALAPEVLTAAVSPALHTRFISTIITDV